MGVLFISMKFICRFHLITYYILKAFYYSKYGIDLHKICQFTKIKSGTKVKKYFMVVNAFIATRWPKFKWRQLLSKSTNMQLIEILRKPRVSQIWVISSENCLIYAKKVKDLRWKTAWYFQHNQIDDTMTEIEVYRELLTFQCPRIGTNKT